MAACSAAVRLDWVTATFEVLLPKLEAAGALAKLTELLSTYNIVLQPRHGSSLPSGGNFGYEELAVRCSSPAAALGSLLQNVPSLARFAGRLQVAATGELSPGHQSEPSPGSLSSSLGRSPVRRLWQPSIGGDTHAAGPQKQQQLEPEKQHHQKQQQPPADHVAVAMPAAVEQSRSTGTATFEVQGMSCGSCVAALESGLLKQQGVLAATAALLTGSLTVTFDQESTDTDAIEKASCDLGYPTRLLRLEGQQAVEEKQGAAAASGGQLATIALTVEGMSCASCVTSVEAAVGQVRPWCLYICCNPVELKHCLFIFAEYSLLAMK